MRDLVKNKITSLWFSGMDEGVPRSVNGQNDDYSHDVQLQTEVVHIKSCIVDVNFHKVLQGLSDTELLEWLDRQLCQRYR